MDRVHLMDASLRIASKLCYTKLSICDLSHLPIGYVVGNVDNGEASTTTQPREVDFY